MLAVERLEIPFDIVLRIHKDAIDESRTGFLRGVLTRFLAAQYLREPLPAQSVRDAGERPHGIGTQPFWTVNHRREQRNDGALIAGKRQKAVLLIVGAFLDQ